MSEKHPLLYEPTTAITDYIIFILGITFGWFTLSIQDSQFHQLWGTSFITIAIGALLGGTTHGFGPKLSQIPRTSYLAGNIDICCCNRFTLSHVYCFSLCDRERRGCTIHYRWSSPYKLLQSYSHSG